MSVLGQVGINWKKLFVLQIKNVIQEEIKCRLKTGNSCYYSDEEFLSSRRLSKNI